MVAIHEARDSEAVRPWMRSGLPSRQACAQCSRASRKEAMRSVNLTDNAASLVEIAAQGVSRPLSRLWGHITATRTCRGGLQGSFKLDTKR